MKRFSVVAFSILISAGFSFADEFASRRMLTMSIGYDWTAAPSLSETGGDRLPAPPESLVGVALQFSEIRTGGFTWGLDMGVAGSPTPARRDDYRIRSDVFFSTLKIGYTFRAGSWGIVALAGPRGQYYGIDYWRQNDTSAEGVLEGGADGGSLEGLTYAPAASLQFLHFQNRTAGDANLKRGPFSILGADIGCAYGPTAVDWRRYDRNVSGGPDYHYQSAYIRFVFGYER